MITKKGMCLTTYIEAWFVCEEIFSIACRELFDSELNHLYTREYREKALSVCKNIASSSYVKKVYDCHCHDHYNVEVPTDIIDKMMEEAVYENGCFRIGEIQRPLR